MEKGGQPPQNSPDVPPPYPGPPLVQSSVVNQPAPAAQAAPQPMPQPAPQPMPQPAPQPMPQPAPQYMPQAAPQTVAQPAPQYMPQPAPQYMPQVAPQPVQQVTVQYTNQQVSQPTNPVVVQALPRDVPGQMFCPHCQNNIVTTTHYKVGTQTWLICGLVALFLCWPCCLIPFCVNDCKDVVHSCPTCQRVVHIYKRR
ncbi:lipopolysaccharide-induced tumor necrosis factor-alpha factor homolog [Kryptolebias marmoratus]|uniref:lipopolysaccharide-induced tumor necrosis factor-alpha factor homolog n=1 Tax=Kryptolebias marmoratus TaxID=37003 RepID=UPI0007F86EAD|nr:lipopolysaccharide-induced tumor necrosis factor-alpha factor homolog [Kryptolebias marmoratus]